MVAYFAHTSTILIGSRVLQCIGGVMIFGKGTIIFVNVFPTARTRQDLGDQCRFRLPGSLHGAVPGGRVNPLFRLEKPISGQRFTGEMIPLDLGPWETKDEWAEARGTGSILLYRQSTARCLWQSCSTFPPFYVAGRCIRDVGSCYLFPVHPLGVARGLPCAGRQALFKKIASTPTPILQHLSATAPPLS